jgi:hypothetical protein
LGILKALLNFGLDKDLLTAANVSPLHFARHFHGDTHKITKYLESIGARDVGMSTETNSKNDKKDEL